MSTIDKCLKNHKQKPIDPKKNDLPPPRQDLIMTCEPALPSQISLNICLSLSGHFILG